MKQRRAQSSESNPRSFRPSSISLIFFLLDSLSEKVYKALVQGFFGKIFTAYSAEQKAFEEGYLQTRFVEKTKLRALFRKLRESLSRSFEESYFVARLQKISAGFMTIPLKAFGNFFLSFGIYTILIYFLRMVLPGFSEASLSFGLMGLGCCIIGFPMIMARTSLAQAILRSRLASFLFVKLFGFRKESLDVGQKGHRFFSGAMIILGMVLGLGTLIVQPQYVLLALLAVIGVVLLFVMPEIGVVVSLGMLPFFYLLSSPSIALGLVVLITAISYLIKLLRGKRIFKFELMDFAVLVFWVILFLSGPITAGGTDGYHEVLISCVLLFGYFLAVNLMRTEQWLNRCLICLVFSGTVTAVAGIFQYLTKDFNTGAWLDLSQFSDIEGRADALFENPNMLAFYLVLVFPFALAMTVRAKETKERCLYIFADLCIVLCTVLTWSRGAWLAMLAELLIFALMFSKKTLRYLILIAFAIPFVPLLLPESVLNRFMSIGSLADSSSMYRIYTWKGSWNLVKEYFWGGIGYGNRAYQEVYPTFAYAGMEAAEHSHNLFLQILIGTGIGGLLIFLAILFMFFQMNLEHVKRSQNRNHCMVLIAAICGVVATLVMGSFDFIWYNYRVFYLFWILVGLAGACIRLGQEDIRRHSYCGEMDQHAAMLDLDL